MKFDAMCRVAERHLPDLAAKLRYASLVRMPGVYTNESPRLEDIGENDDGTKKYTWVRACWVGSTEAEIRGQRYRVELEL